MLSASKRGFTLIELMVSIGIVAILATLGTVFYGQTQGTARDAKRKADLQDIKTALYQWQASTGTFVLFGSSQTSWASQTNDPNWGFSPGGVQPASLKNTLEKYFKPGSVPRLDSKGNPYFLSLAPETFTLYAILEGNGGAVGNCSVPYTNGNTYNYCITN